jgi:hypothetical protein
VSIWTRLSRSLLLRAPAVSQSLGTPRVKTLIAVTLAGLVVLAVGLLRERSLIDRQGKEVAGLRKASEVLQQSADAIASLDPWIVLKSEHELDFVAPDGSRTHETKRKHLRFMHNGVLAVRELAHVTSGTVERDYVSAPAKHSGVTVYIGGTALLHRYLGPGAQP